jgi:hypothetical protein
MKPLVLLAALLPALASAAGSNQPLDFQVRVETVLKHDDGRFLWYHPRVAAIPGAGKDGKPAVLMTLQKHLRVSDHYSGLHVMRTDDLGASWAGPVARPELDWRTEDRGCRWPSAT